jgi:hypothetical protein
MKISSAACAMRVIRPWGQAMIILLVSFVSARAQRYEVTPLIGGMFGGSIDLEEQGVPNFNAYLGNRFSFGIAGGVRFDGEDCESCDSIQFRWVRQYTHLGLGQNLLEPPAVGPPSFNPRVTLDEFLADFSHEAVLKETKRVRPYVVATLGAASMATPESSAARFVWGIGGGLKVFPKPRWGFRIQAEYLPIVLQTETQRVVCTSVGCIVALSSGFINQFQLSVGPSFRF